MIAIGHSHFCALFRGSVKLTIKTVNPL